jgi:hypothetical protein
VNVARTVIHITYWVISGLTLVALLAFPYIQALQASKAVPQLCICYSCWFILCQTTGIPFFLTDDLRRGAIWLMSKIFPIPAPVLLGDNSIPRSTFLSWLGLGVGGALFGTLIYGFSNKYNYQVRKVKLAFANLPAGFQGLAHCSYQ